jgi:chromosomal replication initiator protein
LARLADAIAQRVGQQRFHVWFNNSTRLDLRQDGLEIAVPNDFISEWIGKNFTRPIQEAAHEVLGGPLLVRFNVVPELFEVGVTKDDAEEARPAATNRSVNSSHRHLAGSPLAPSGGPGSSLQAGSGQASSMDSPGSTGSATSPRPGSGRAGAGVGGIRPMPQVPAHEPSRADDPTAVLTEAARPVHFSPPAPLAATRRIPKSDASHAGSFIGRPRLRHDVQSFIVGPSNQLAYNTALYVAEFPGAQYNPLFIHGACGLGKTHLLQGLCRKFIETHATKRWMYLTGEEFTNEFLSALRANRVDGFRRKMRELDLLVIDDVHFLGGKRATQEEFLHTFNAIEAMGRQVVMASDNHPKLIEEFGESLINRFVSGMVVRIDPPNFSTRCDILRALSVRMGLPLSEEVIGWVARRVTQNVRELEGAMTRVAAHVNLTGRPADVATAQASLGDLDRQLVAPVRPENVMQSVCNYFGLENKDLMSGRRQRTISLARSVAMYLVRKTAKLSFPEIGTRMGKRNHSTVISACRRIERAVQHNEKLAWSSSVGEREEEAAELLQRLEEHSRAMN